MEETYLVIDLRGNQCAPGLLTIGKGLPRWYEQSILRIVKDFETGTVDSVSVAPLSFVRRPQERAWSVVDDARLLRVAEARVGPRPSHTQDVARSRPEQVVTNFLQRLTEQWFSDAQVQSWPGGESIAGPSEPVEFEAGVEVVPALFDEPRERLEALLPGTLGPLLKTTMDHYAQRGTVAGRVMLMESSEACDVLTSRFEAYLESERIRVSVPGGFGALGGFALALDEMETGGLPDEGAMWICQLKNSDTIRRYTWDDAEFSYEVAETGQPAAGESVHVWESAEELERVGAALFALFWEDRLIPALDERVDSLQQQLEYDRRLLELLRAAHDGLADAVLVPGGVDHRRSTENRR